MDFAGQFPRPLTSLAPSLPPRASSTPRPHPPPKNTCSTPFSSISCSRLGLRTSKVAVVLNAVRVKGTVS